MKNIEINIPIIMLGIAVIFLGICSGITIHALTFINSKTDLMEQQILLLANALKDK